MEIKGGLLKAIKEKVEYTSVEITPDDSEVLVDLKASSLNRRDLWIQEGKYAKIRLPCIVGSDGSGIYDGREVILLPSMKWGSSASHQSTDFEVLGMPHHGCCAEKIAIRPEYIFDKPSHLTHLEAASLPLSGLTAWRALMTQGQAKPDQKILITGIGGGVAGFVLLFAVAHGMEVYVTSSSDNKIARSVALGAVGGENYRNPESYTNLTKAASGFDVIIDSAGGGDFHKLLKIANPGARIVQYGGTQGAMDGISPQILFWKQLTIKGSTMGTREEFANMLEFINLHRLRPCIDKVFPLSEVNQAFDYMKSGSHFGKIVLDHS
ncbi:MAG: zinc-binding dehydrogenase [Saprospiraceae bacterium]|nr:zinc-binding dehydrogenase [Saprospiraceae bacterium]